MPPSLNIDSKENEIKNQPHQVDPSPSHEAKHDYLVHLSYHIYVTTPR